MQAVLAQNWRALAATGALAVGYLGACSAVGRARLLPPRLARKLTHIGAGRLPLPALPCCRCLLPALPCGNTCFLVSTPP